MIKIAKFLIYGFLGFFLLSVIAVALGFDEVKEENDNNVSVISDTGTGINNDILIKIQDWCFDKNMTAERLAEYPSFNLITRDFKEYGKNDFYIYSSKLNMEIRVKDNVCVDAHSGSKWR